MYLSSLPKKLWSISSTSSIRTALSYMNAERNPDVRLASWPYPKDRCVSSRISTKIMRNTSSFWNVLIIITLLTRKPASRTRLSRSWTARWKAAKDIWPVSTKNGDWFSTWKPLTQTVISLFPFLMSGTFKSYVCTIPKATVKPSVPAKQGLSIGSSVCWKAADMTEKRFRCYTK